MTTRATRSPRRRTVVALAVVLSVIGAFTIRLVDIQVVNADAHIAESHDLGDLAEKRDIEGARGNIVDTDGAVLAEGRLVYDAQLDPYTMTVVDTDEDRPPKMFWDEASEKIAAVTGQTTEEIRTLVADALEENPKNQYAPLKRGLTTEQYLTLRDLKLPYLAMIPRSIRVYPNGAVAGNVIGFVGFDGEPLAGLEMTEDTCLAPQMGQESFLRGRDGGIIIPGSHKVTPAVNGGTLRLTIDSELQWYMQQMIAEEVSLQGAQYGTVMVVDVKTGKVRAAAEFPSVDPNDPTASDENDRGARIFSDTFEPGSTYKAVTAAAVLEKGGATPLTVVSAESREEFPNGVVINDAFYHPRYDYTLAGALVDSSNVALSKYGDMVSEQVRYDYLEKFGVGQTSAIDFPGEGTGQLHPVEDWDDRSHYTTTFGQFYTVTVPQLASTYQVIANGGVKMPLSLIESCTSADGELTDVPEVKSERIIQKQTAADLSRMLENVAFQGGLADEIKIDGYRIAAKTGTAEKPDLVNGGYKDGAFYTSMAGFAPVDDPQYVVVVTLDEPTRVTSSAATASAFNKAMTQVLKSFRVMPSSVPREDPLPLYR